MLDAIEAGITALQSRSSPGPPAQAGPEAAARLRAELRSAGISAAEFARLACVQQAAVEDWTSGASAAPQWVSAAIRLVALLTPSARYRLLHDPLRVPVNTAEPTRSHPFSRIEDL